MNGSKNNGSKVDVFYKFFSKLFQDLSMSKIDVLSEAKDIVLLLVKGLLNLALYLYN